MRLAAGHCALGNSSHVRVGVRTQRGIPNRLFRSQETFYMAFFKQMILDVHVARKRDVSLLLFQTYKYFSKQYPFEFLTSVILHRFPHLSSSQFSHQKK